MTAESKTIIKTYFETGDFPTQAQFANLIDSYQNVNQNLSAITSAVGSASSGGYLRFVNASTATLAQSIPVSAGGITVSASNVLLGNVSAGVATELTSTDFAFSGSTVNLNPTGVSAGSYQNAQFTVDAKGRITQVSAGSSSGITRISSAIITSATSEVTIPVPTGYDSYQIQLINTGAQDDTFNMRFNYGGGIVTTSAYTGVVIPVIQASASNTTVGFTGSTRILLFNSAGTTGAPINGTVNVNTGGFGYVDWNLGRLGNGTVATQYLRSTGNAYAIGGGANITEVQFFFGSKNITTMRWILFGVNA